MCVRSRLWGYFPLGTILDFFFLFPSSSSLSPSLPLDIISPPHPLSRTLVQTPLGEIPPPITCWIRVAPFLSGCIDDLSTPETPLFLASILLFCLSTSTSCSLIFSKSRHFSIVIVLRLPFPDAARLITTTRNLLVHKRSWSLLRSESQNPEI